MDNGGMTVENRVDSGRYTVAVALSNPGHVEQLMRTAVDVARGVDGELVVVSVVHKPVTSPFLLFSNERIKLEFDDDRQQILDRAVDIAHEASVPVRTDLMVDNSVANAILASIDAHDVDALVLGWHERPRATDVVLGTTVDSVVRRAPCDVFVERVGTTADGLRTILLPTDGGPHAEAATDLVRAVATATGAAVTVVSYVIDGSRESDPAVPDLESAREHVADAADRLQGVVVEPQVTTADDVAGAIITSAASHDLVVLGATRERHVRERVVGSVAETVGRQVDSPVVIARRGTGRSLLGKVLSRLR